MKNIFKLYNIFLLLLIIFFIGLTYIYQKEEASLRSSTLNKIKTQSEYINEYFYINKAFILSLKNTLESNLNIQDLIHPLFNNIKNKKDIGIYNIVCNDKSIKFTLNGIGSIDEIDLDTIQELNSVLYLNPLFRTILNSKHGIPWVYYSSVKNFIYIASSNNVWDKKFLKYLYTKEFWTEAIPKNNPKKKLILTKIYNDAAGKGYLTTLSLPIFYDNVFKGVLSIDISLNILNKMLNKIDLPGKVYLIKKDNSIIASNQIFKLNEKLKRNKETFSINLFDDNLKLLYIENKKDVIITILSNTFPVIMLLLFSLIIVCVLAHTIMLIKKIKEIANRDFLTSLLNRRAMMKEMSRQLSIANRYNQSTALLLVDIDFFKRVNDTYGHQVGDIAIQQISNVLSKNVRESDLVSRYGGEEFLILLYNTNIDDAYILAERIRKEIGNLKIKEIDFQITVSIGCTEYIKNESIDDFINRSDLLLYEAKEKGRNQTIKA
ncbi:sensor domain-containing diguanylate cyclase [Poseidonibacter antarcticus]|uniref:sensor domain-containing diguanylate cyclase n=1 Tax=Poseidonibacter antarcticus TaxID=2478538 RepID=UPI000EF47BC5|nr:sensor domain-containing diguanylate cyclase [Poseidonibacter antarcticus]